MDITNKLREICGHDSRDVDGCVTCEAAETIDILRRRFNKQRIALNAVADDWDGEKFHNTDPETGFMPIVKDALK